jgi:CRISPR-associated protein Csx17
LLPLKRGKEAWYLPPPKSKDRSKQAVWSGTDVCHDLAHILSRRYLDSLDDEHPALMAPRPAPLDDILAFLNHDLDDHRIARWTEALSLIGWHFEKEEESADPSASSEEQSLEDEQQQFPAVPLAYAALRSVIEMECEWQGNDSSLWKKRRSHRPISLLCQRTPSSLALAVEDALRWLAIWRVPNCWGEAARREKPRLGGRDVIRVDHRELNLGEGQSRLVNRLAAAVLIPLDWRDHGKLYRTVTLPQTTKH